MFDFEGIKIKWLGHSGFKIKKRGKVIYVDPYQIEDTEPADLILITHDHYDHCSPEDIKKIIKEDTVIIGSKDAVKKLSGNTIYVKPGDRKEAHEIVVDAVPAYNIAKKFHPKEKEFVGFVITIDGKRIYHAGDTDYIPEMDKLAVDIAMLPVGGEFTMSATEAALAANKIRPKIAIPMHFGTIIGSKEDAERFAKECECEVRILLKNEE